MTKPARLVIWRGFGQQLGRGLDTTVCPLLRVLVNTPVSLKAWATKFGAGRVTLGAATLVVGAKLFVTAGAATLVVGLKLLFTVITGSFGQPQSGAQSDLFAA